MASPRVQPGSTPEPPERDLAELAMRLRPGTATPSTRASGDAPADYREGDAQSFFVTDLVEGSVHSVTATLAVISEHALWYVDDTLDIDAEDLKAAAEAYEDNIYPVMAEAVGEIRSPGIDNDPRLTVLTTRLTGAAGYFGSQDEYPRQTHPFSNEREMVYMDGSLLDPKSRVYQSVLAHELQHAVHSNADAGEDAWVNEGMSEVAKGLAGFGYDFVGFFLRKPQTQLDYWPDGLNSTPPHYGAATLFIAYLAEHYGGPEGLRALVHEPLDGVAGVEAYLATQGTTFEEVFKDWVIANYLNDDQGPYGYGGEEHRVQKIEVMSRPGERSGVQPQLSARYVVARLEEGDATIRFDGETEVAQFGTSCRSGDRCWWSNRGDSIDTTLTREFDLTELSDATLQFWAWFEIEKGWDYAYVEVSTDGGETWEVLKGTHTSEENPVGNSYGPGFTGASDGWVQESIDLTPYVGHRVLVRFEYITDEGVYLDGLVLDDIEVPELAFADDAEADVGWEARGFVRSDNRLAQTYAVQVIERSSGEEDRVREMALDESNAGELVVESFGSDVANAVVVISPMTANTTQPARYTLTVEVGDE